jgi:hypothetical protein
LYMPPLHHYQLTELSLAQPLYNQSPARYSINF